MIDLIVGFNMTPLLWKNIKHEHKIKLSAGRCQTPALKIIYDKYKENLNKCLKQVFNTTGYFTNLFISFDLSKQFETEVEVENFLELSKTFHHKCLGFVISKHIQESPKPFTTSKILQVSPYSPKETMDILQTLYEDGLITYIRTDSYHYSNEFITSVEKYIMDNYNEKYIKTNISNNSLKSAHEPIRPTNIYLNKISSQYSSKEIKIYNIIWENSLQSCMSDSIYDSMDFSLNAPNNLIYKKNTKKIIFDGWEKVKEIKLNNKEYDYLLHLKNNIIIPFKKIN